MCSMTLSRPAAIVQQSFVEYALQLSLWYRRDMAAPMQGLRETLDAVSDAGVD